MLDGNVYVVGGADGNTTLNTIYRFDPATASVTQLGSLPFALTNAAAVPADGKIVVIGGTRTVAGDQTAEILAFSATGHPITVLGTLPVKLDDPAAWGCADWLSAYRRR